MMAAIESAGGVLNAREIAQSSDRLVGIAIGAEELCKKYENNTLSWRYRIIICT